MVVFDTLKFKLTVELVAEAIGVRNEGEMWFKKLPFAFDAQRYLWELKVKGNFLNQISPSFLIPIASATRSTVNLNFRVSKTTMA